MQFLTVTYTWATGIGPGPATAPATLFAGLPGPVAAAAVLPVPPIRIAWLARRG